jgi:hypothetical protein
VCVCVSVLLTSPSLFSYAYSYPLTFSPFPVQQSIVLSPNYSFCPFSSTLSPCHHLFLLSSPNLLSYYLSLLCIQHLLTSLVYQLYTIPSPAIPDTSTFHYNRNTPKYAQGPQNPTTPIPLPQHPPLFLLLLLEAPLPISQISTFSLITIILPTPTVYRCYHQGVFYIVCKQLVCIEPVNLLLLNYTSRPGTERAHQPS